MPLIILMWQNRLEKVHRIHENGVQNFHFFSVQTSYYPIHISQTGDVELILDTRIK